MLLKWQSVFKLSNYFPLQMGKPRHRGINNGSASSTIIQVLFSTENHKESSSALAHITHNQICVFAAGVIF